MHPPLVVVLPCRFREIFLPLHQWTNSIVEAINKSWPRPRRMRRLKSNKMLLPKALADWPLRSWPCHPEIEKIARIGAAGRLPGNMHRDLLHISGKSLLLQDSTVTVPIQLKATKFITKPVPLQFLLPHKLFANLYRSLPNAFTASILGGSPDNILAFWTAMQHHPIVTSRPHLQNMEQVKMKVPIGIHGDGVAYMQVRGAGSKSLDALSWSSLLTKGATKVSSFLMILLVKSVVKDTGVMQSWPRIWRILCWSLEALAQGTSPTHNWDHAEFEDKESIDYKMRGSPLAGGYSAMVFVLRADLDFLANHFGLNSPASNKPCCLCQADREMQSRPWTDCRPSAAWWATCWTPEAWALAHPDRHPFFRMAGSGLDMLYPDLMHTKHLGTDQLILGSSLCWLTKHFLKGSMASNLDLVWSFLQKWYKDVQGELTQIPKAYSRDEDWVNSFVSSPLKGRCSSRENM